MKNDKNTWGQKLYFENEKSGEFSINPVDIDSPITPVMRPITMASKYTIIFILANIKSANNKNIITPNTTLAIFIYINKRNRKLKLLRIWVIRSFHIIIWILFWFYK